MRCNEDILKHCQRIMDTAPMKGADDITSWRAALSVVHGIELGFLRDPKAIDKHLEHVKGMALPLQEFVQEQIGPPPHTTVQLAPMRNTMLTCIEMTYEET